jgi:FkbM family methyltransferase
VGERVLPITCVVNGDTLYLSPEFARDEQLGNEWEPELYAGFKASLRPGMTVFDVGASFGLYTVAAARAVGRTGHVVAFEPAPRTAAALREHLAFNGVAGVVEVLEVAATDRSGQAVFWEQGTSYTASLQESVAREEARRYRAPVSSRVVRAVALDDVWRARRVAPDVVKVDVEGGEAAVLRGARDLLARRRGAVFLEIHAGFAGAGPASAVFTELETAGWGWEQVGAEAATRHYRCAPATAT